MTATANARFVVPAQIVSEILSHLDTVDLLNCRLVSKSWNKHCLAALEKKNSQVHIALDKSNIESFLSLANSSYSSGLLRQLRACICDWKFAVDIVWDGLTEAQCRRDFKPFDRQVVSVINTFGPECVDRVTLETNYFGGVGDEVEVGIEISELSKLFNNLSEGLTQVKVKGTEYEGLPDSTCPIRLSKLTSFECTSTTFPAEEYLQSFQHSLVKYFCLQNMANLEKFKVMVAEHGWYALMDFQKMSNLQLVYSYPEDLLASIRRCPGLPVLRKLAMGWSRLDNDARVWVDLLTFLAATLESLTLIGNSTEEPYMFPLPSLPNLQKFRIDLRTDQSQTPSPSQLLPILPIDSAMNHFNSQTLPALEHVDLSIQYRFVGRHTLQSVVRLTLRILDEQKSPGEFLKGNVSAFQKMFPNLRSVRVVDETLDEKKTVLKDLLLVIMKSGRSLRLEQLVIRNGDEESNTTNFLADALTDLEFPPSLTFQNLDKRVVTKDFEKAAQDFLQTWTGQGKTVRVQVEEENGLTGDKKMMTLMVPPNSLNFCGVRNVSKVRLEQFSSRANEKRKLAKKKSARSEFPKSQFGFTFLEPHQLYEKNRREIALMVRHFPKLVQLEISPPFFGETNKAGCVGAVQQLATIFPGLNIRLI